MFLYLWFEQGVPVSGACQYGGQRLLRLASSFVRQALWSPPNPPGVSNRRISRHVSQSTVGASSCSDKRRLCLSKPYKLSLFSKTLVQRKRIWTRVHLMSQGARQAEGRFALLNHFDSVCAGSNSRKLSSPKTSRYNVGVNFWTSYGGPKPSCRPKVTGSRHLVVGWEGGTRRFSACPIWRASFASRWIIWKTPQ